MLHLIYNPIAGGKNGKKMIKTVSLIENALKEKNIEYALHATEFKGHATKITKDLTENGVSDVVVIGGDGTLHEVINGFTNFDKCALGLIPCGTGNDFVRDIDHEGDPIDVTEYIKDLPAVTVNGKSYKFLNNVGFGIDGYCCEVGDAMKNEGKTDINYTAIAIKGLLFGFKPRGATVTVDGVKSRYENVWLAPTMKGRFYGGGMMPTPKQDRKDPEGKVSVMVMHKKSKLKTLTVFPSIFKGEHIKHTDMVTVLEGNSIKVRFDIPAAVQIDGETVLNVTEYEVFAGKPTERGREEIHKGYDTSLI